MNVILDGLIIKMEKIGNATATVVLDNPLLI
jgi:hypothetical protein